MTVEKKLSAFKRRTRAEVQQLVAEFVSSGMRRSEFCRSRGLSFGTLNRHLKKQRWKKKSRAGASAILHPPSAIRPWAEELPWCDEKTCNIRHAMVPFVEGLSRSDTNSRWQG
jgi:hypothetical protein